jgi:hypothetical protein
MSAPTPAVGRDVPDAGPPDPDVLAETFDRRLERQTPLYAAAERSLTWGFRLTVALLALGLALAIAGDDSVPETAEPLPEIVSLVLEGDGAGLIDLAIVTMVLTPVATVCVLALGFLRIGDRRYALVTFVVLAILGVTVTISLLR